MTELKTNPNGLTQREINFTLGKNVKDCLVFEKNHTELLYYEDKIMFDYYSNYRNSYISRWDLKVRIKINR